MQKPPDEAAVLRSILAGLVDAIDKKWEYEPPRKRANGVSPRMEDALSRAREVL